MGLEKINDYKKIKNLTNKDISYITGISLSSLDKITSGSNTNPKLETVKLICGALGCTLSDLIDDDNTDELTLQEQNYIKKYRALDEHGKDMVDTVLSKEYQRCKENNIKVSDYTQNIAAGTGEEGFTDSKINEVNDFAKQIYDLENDTK